MSERWCWLREHQGAITTPPIHARSPDRYISRIPDRYRPHNTRTNRITRIIPGRNHSCVPPRPGVTPELHPRWNFTLYRRDFFTRPPQINPTCTIFCPPDAILTEICRNRQKNHHPHKNVCILNFHYTPDAIKDTCQRSIILQNFPTRIKVLLEWNKKTNSHRSSREMNVFVLTPYAFLSFLNICIQRRRIKKETFIKYSSYNWIQSSNKRIKINVFE